MSSDDDWNAQWRASAHEAVPYTEDYPEAFLVLPEPIDGAIGAGKATNVLIDITLPEPGSDALGTLIVRDNGLGLRSLSRMLSWASTHSTHTHHRYGHGSKKFLTKWMRDYAKAEWYLRWRTQDKKGREGPLNTIKFPFRGGRTEHEEDAENETDVMPSGTEWTLRFHTSILKTYNTPGKIVEAIKEILRTRYSKKYFDETEFEVVVRVAGIANSQKSSNSRKQHWKTLQEMLDEDLGYNQTYIRYNTSVPIEGGKMHYKEYYVIRDGRERYPIWNAFPVYGRKNMHASRVHIAINGRFIEPMPIHKTYGREMPHNDFNGTIGFADFVADSEEDYEKLPQPCTTKVSFYENCPQFRKAMEELRKIHKGKELPYTFTAPATAPAPAEPAPAEPAPATAPAPAEPATAPAPAEPTNALVFPPPVVPELNPYQRFMKETIPKLTTTFPDWSSQQRTTEMARLWQIEKFKQSVKIANYTAVTKNDKSFTFLSLSEILALYPEKFLEYLDALQNLQDSLKE